MPGVNAPLYDGLNITLQQRMTNAIEHYERNVTTNANTKEDDVYIYIDSKRLALACKEVKRSISGGAQLSD